MNRRNFVKATVDTVVTGLVTSSIPYFAYHIPSAEYDKYGGWTGKKFKATGFFRVTKDDRWWIVTPEGNAFISFGINHYHASWWAQDYNRDFWFNKFGAKKVGDKNWERGFQKMVLTDLTTFGLNTLGVHTNAPSLTDPPLGPVLPYVRRYEPVILSHYKNPKHIDIFDPSFLIHCDEVAQKMAAPYAHDPMLLGYCMSDLPSMTDEDARIFNSTTWPRELRNKGGNAAGKNAWMNTIQSRYKDIAEFNSVYETNFTSWDELKKAENWRPSKSAANVREDEDNIAFLKICIDRYYSIAEAALRKVDKNHLFFGDKTNAETNSLKSIIDITSKYIDLVCYQSYARWEDQKALLDNLAPRIDLPFLNGDSNYATPNEMLPNPYGQHAKSHTERAEWMKEFCEGAFPRKEFVGWHMCGIIDTWKSMPTKEINQQQGIMSVSGEVYPDEVKVIKDISAKLYTLAVKNCK
jgi:hypothetical protein